MKQSIQFWSGIALCTLATISPTRAQIIPDATLPQNSSVSTQGNTSNITGGTAAGGNLFHSFEQFFVPTGGTAYFNNALDIQNVISRVTGGSVSSIDGLLRANGTANLFLLNPNGIIFGPNATLNIGGSFVGSTASSLNFADGTQFSATAHPTTPLLTISVPIGLQFGPTAGGIRSSGTTLRVSEGQSLLLLGGNVTLDDSFLYLDYSSGGRIDLGGVSGPGTVGLNVDGNNLRLSFPDNLARADVSLSNGARLEVLAEDGGSIAINAQDLDVSGGSVLAAGIAPYYGAVDSQAGDITLNATGAVTVTDSSTISNKVESRAVGQGGNIDITAGSLEVKNGARLNASTSGQGDAGSVNINIRDAVSFNGVGSLPSSALSNVEWGAYGNAGSINITAGSLSVTNGARVESLTHGQGNAGSVNINGREWVSFDGVGSNGWISGAYSTVESGESKAVGNGGGINITTGSVSVTNGAELNASTSGLGDAGNVTITTSGPVFLDGVGNNGNHTRVFSNVEQPGVGKGGNVSITSGSLSVTNGAELSSNTFGKGNAGSVNILARDHVSFDGLGSVKGGYFVSSAFSGVGSNAEGNGGEVRVKAGSLSVSNGAQLGSGTSGIGNAGNVTIQTSGSVSFDGVGRYGSPSSAHTTVESTKAVGNGGDINITSGGSLELKNGAQLRSLNAGRGNAGNVSIQADNAVSLAGLGTVIFSNVEPKAQGNSGNISIKAKSLSLTRGPQLQTQTAGQGNAGDVSIQADKAVSLDDSIIFSSMEPGSVGKAGDINIKTGALFLTRGAQLQTQTAGQGNAGNVSIQADNAVSLDDSIIFSSVEAVEPIAVGNGGNINIKTGSLSLSNTSELHVNTDGQGNAGNVNIQAEQLFLNSNSALIADVSESGRGQGGTIVLDVEGAILLTGGSPAPTGESTRITLGVLPGGIGSGGDLNIKAGSLVLTNGAIIKNSTQGQGNAGNIKVNAGIVDILGSVPSTGLPSGLFTSTDTTGRAGNISVDTRTFRVADGAALSAHSKGQGQGGDIRVNATDSFEAVNGGQLVTTTFGQGQAGNIFVNATDRVTVSGSDPNYSNRIAKFPSPISPYVANAITETGSASGLFANTETDSTGLGGGIRIKTRQLLVQDRAQVNVSSQGLGSAGNLEVVEANSIRLDKRATLRADTTAGQGNIILHSQDLVLRRGSNITTNATGTAEGGNINIDTGVIAALENSDISANAEEAFGGQVIIDAQGIFGTEFRNRLTPESDITATSNLGLQFSGTVEINTPDIDPILGLTTLPAELVDVTRLIAQGCPGGGGNVGRGASEFIITGRGGLPPSPSEALRSDAVRVDLRASIIPATNQSSGAIAPQSRRPTAMPLVEAQGWVSNAKGEVFLTATAPTPNPHSPWLPSADCHASN